MLLLIEEIAIILAGLSETEKKTTLKELLIFLLSTTMLDTQELQDMYDKAKDEFDNFLAEQSKEQNQ